MSQSAKIWLLRGVIWVTLLVELLVVAGVISTPDSQITWFWFAYVVIFYLLFFEAGMFFTRKNPARRDYFVLAGFFVALNIALDAAGGILNLYETVPIYDQVIHATSLPFVISATALGVGRIIGETYDLQLIRWFLPYFILASAMLLMSVHELFELAVDLITGTNSGTGATNIHDTSFDLLFDFVGTIVFIVGHEIYQSIVRRRKTQT